MSVAEPNRSPSPPSAYAVRGAAIRTQVRGKWHSDRYCERCGLLAVSPPPLEQRVVLTRAGCDASYASIRSS